MAGEMSGLILSEALASVPDDCERELVKRLLIVAEIAFLSARRQKADAEKDNADAG